MWRQSWRRCLGSRSMNMNQPMIRVLCVDDNAALIDGLQIKLALESDIEWVGRAQSADDLIAEVRDADADVVLLDIDMPGRESLEALEELTAACPEVRVIILSGYVREDFINRSLDAGAWGYLAKSEEPNVIVSAIRGVFRGE